MSAPYARIVAALRERIDSGELAPGDRIPSTRQLAREWNVALATATKAMGALRQLGLIEAVPRVGTVVATEPAASRSPRRPVLHEGELSRDQVVRTAITIADAEGLAAVSMRTVAAKLDVATMSLYRYVESKDDLVLLMIDAAFAEGTYPASPPPGWRARLELSARGQWEIYREHPWLAHLMPLGRPVPLRGVLLHGDWMLAALEPYVVDPSTALHVQITVYNFVRGVAANLETEAQAEADTGLTQDEWMDAQQQAYAEVTRSGDYPALSRLLDRLGEGGFDFDLTAIFEFGLRALLNGLTEVIERDY